MSGTSNVGGLERRVTSTCVNFDGLNLQTLGLPANTFGVLVSLVNHGTGFFRVSFAGTDPSTESFPEVDSTSRYNRLNNVRLDLLRFRGSVAGSDYTICYEVYT